MIILLVNGLKCDTQRRWRGRAMVPGPGPGDARL